MIGGMSSRHARSISVRNCRICVNLRHEYSTSELASPLRNRQKCLITQALFADSLITSQASGSVSWFVI